MAQKLVFGSPGAPDLANTKCLLVWSLNPFYSGPPTGRAVQKSRERGIKMIVVDPRKTPTTTMADIHLQLRPGTDGALALSMANIIINEILYEADFVANYTYGFDEYREYVNLFPPEKGGNLTGVPAQKIIEAARVFATIKPASVMPSALGI